MKNILNESQIQELKRLKAYFPFRIVWACITQSGEFSAQASPDKRAMNKELRAGNQVFTLN